MDMIVIPFASRKTSQFFETAYFIFPNFRNNTEVTSAHSDTEARKATVRLLRTIILLTQTLDSLPSNVMMTMKLFYYDEGLHFVSFLLLV